MPTRITIDPNAVVRNWTKLNTLSGGAQCGAVVKANAYGFGVDVVCPKLWDAGARRFFVATEAEGFALRTLLPDAIVYVLNGLFDDPAAAIAARLIPFHSSASAVAEWPEDAPFALNVDTGMNRLGVTPAEATEMAASGVRPELLASHFACADTPDHPLNQSQEAAFAAVRPAFANAIASLANSAAILTRPSARYDLTRPGIALYGGGSAVGAAPMETAVLLEARLIQVRDVPAGDPVGYGAAQHMTRPSRIAIASVGYADGYLRAGGGSNTKTPAPVAIGGVRVPLAGRVSMDLVAIDVTDVPCERGDWVELIGPNIPVDEVAEAAGTIGYEFFTSLSRRAERRVGPL